MTENPIKRRIAELVVGLREKKERLRQTLSFQSTAPMKERVAFGDQARYLEQEADKLEDDLARAQLDLRAEEALAQLPKAESQIQKAESLVAERNKLAEDIQHSLDNLGPQLQAFDDVTEELFAIERANDAELRGPVIGSSVFHPLWRGDSLRRPLKGALEGTPHTKLIKVTSLGLESGDLWDFGVVERKRGEKFMNILKGRLARLRKDARQEETRHA
jgi:hypothetical protein